LLLKRYMTVLLNLTLLKFTFLSN